MRLSDEGATQLDELLLGAEHPRLTMMLAERGMVVRAVPRPDSCSDVTVVIPTTRDGGALRVLIESLPGECWVIVVNDGEHDVGTVDDRTTVLRTSSPRSGPSAARNVGLRSVTTKYVAFIDDDVQVPRNWVALMRGHFDDDQVTLAAGRIRSADGAGIAGYLERHACALDMGAHSGPVGLGRNIPYVPSAAFMARTAALDDGFDETLRLGEDVDLVWRTPGLAVYDAGIEVRHAARERVGEVLKRRFEYGTSAALLDRRHPGALAHLVLSDWTVLPWLGLTVFGVPGAAVGFAASLIQGPSALPNFPTGVAVETMARGQLHAAKATSRASIRPYWPLTLAASLVSRKFRRRVLPALALGYVLGGGNPATVVDDLAYGTGVWAGCIRTRNFRPLLPQFRRSR